MAKKSENFSGNRKGTPKGANQKKGNGRLRWLPNLCVLSHESYSPSTLSPMFSKASSHESVIPMFLNSPYAICVAPTIASAQDTSVSGVGSPAATPAMIPTASENAIASQRFTSPLQSFDAHRLTI